MKRRTSVEGDYLSKLSTEYILSAVDSLPAAGLDVKSWRHCVFMLFLYYNRITSKLIYIHYIFDLWHSVQLFAAANSLPLILSIVNGKQDITSNSLFSILLFIIPNSLDQDNIYYITSLLLLTGSCYFVFLISLSHVKRKKAFHPWQVFFSYMFSVEFSRILVIPNLVLLSRSFIASVVGIHPKNYIWTAPLLFSSLLIVLTYYTSIYQLSYFGSPKIPRSLLIIPDQIQMSIIPFIGWGVFSGLSQNNAIYLIVGLYVMIGLIYLYIGIYPKSFRNTVDPISLAISVLMLFEACSGVVFARGLNRLSYTYFIVASITIAIGVYLVMINIEKLNLKHYKWKLNSANKFKDLNITSSRIFLKYLCAAYYSHHRFLFDGSIIKFASEHYHDIYTSHMMLRLAMHLPLNTPYVNLILTNCSTLNMNSTEAAYYVFEYKTILGWRSETLDPAILEDISKTFRLAKSFIKIAFSYSSFIQQEGASSSFIFGQALAEFARYLESQIDKYLLLYPTQIPVLKMASFFYERIIMDKQKTREINHHITLYEYFTSILPSWRELQTILNTPITVTDILQSQEKLNTGTSEDKTDSTTLVNDKLLANDLVFYETHGWRSIHIYLLVLFFFGILPFLVTIFISCRSSQKDFRALISMTEYFGEHVYHLVGLMVYGIKPVFQRQPTFDDLIKINEYIDDFSNAHANISTKIMLLFNTYRNLEKSCAHLYRDDNFPSITFAGTTRYYNYDSIMRRIQTNTRELYRSRTMNKTNINEVNVIMNMFANSSVYFKIFLNLYNGCLDEYWDIIEHDTIKWSTNWFFVVCGIVILINSISLFMYVSLRKMSKSFIRTSSSKESRLMEVNLSQRYKHPYYYLTIGIPLSLMTLIFIFLSALINRIAQIKLQDSVKTVTYQDLSDIIQMAILGTALTSIEMKGMKVNVSNEKLYENIASVTSIWHKSDIDWKHINENSSSTQMFEVVQMAMMQLKGAEIDYNASLAKAARDIYQNELRPIFLERITNRSSIYWNSRLMINMKNGVLQALVFHLIMFVFYLIGSVVIYFMQSVIFTEFVLKIIPYVHQQESNSHTVMTGSSEAKLILDMLGVPGAVIDINDNIIFVNHEWMSMFSGTQTTFIGVRYQVYVAHDPDIAIFPSFQDKRIVVINRSAKIVKLRKQISTMTDEYDRLNESAMPVNILSNIEKTKKFICATISIISFNLQNEDIDLVRSFTDIMFKRIMEELEMIPDAKLLMWSYSDITITFGFGETKLLDAALQALNLVAMITQMFIETEDIYGLYCSSSIMLGEIGGNFDGAKSRSWRITNSITLSPDVTQIILNYIADITYVLDNEIAIIVLENTYDDLSDD